MNAFQIWVDIDRLHRNLSKLIGSTIRENSELNLDAIEWMLMNSLMKEDGQHASTLANSVGRAATSFTPILDRLQTKGYVERRSDKSDRRAVRVFMTKKGRLSRAKIEALNPVILAALAKYFEENNLGPVWEQFLMVTSTK